MRRLASVFLLLSACAHAPPVTPESAPAATQPAAAAAPAPSTADEGTFTIIIGGKDVGSETFAIRDVPAGHELKSRTEMHLGAAVATSDGVLVTDPSWRPVSGETKRQAGEAGGGFTLARKEDGSLVQKLTSARGQETEVPETEKSDLYLGEISFSHLTPFCVLAGDQPRDFSIFPGKHVRMGGRQPLPEELAGKRTLTFVPIVGGKSGIELFCEGKKVAVARYPDFNLTAVRKGYDDVAVAIIKAESHKPDVPKGLVELPRKVQSAATNGAVLGCSILLPADRSGTLPAVIFVTASGPQDRDDDTPGSAGIKMALFKNLAIALAQNGVASLRCDDRGVAESTGSISGATLATLVEDANAALQVLKQEPGIDQSRLAVIGHGEGATVAAMVAEKDPSVKALGLLAPPGRSLDQMLLDQRDDVNRKQGFKEDYVVREHKRMAAIYAALKAGKRLPEDATDEERSIIAPAIDWLQSHFRHDPLKTLAKLKVAIFVAEGGKDAEISPKEDFERVRKTLAGRKNAEAKVYPTLSYVLSPTKAGDASDYSDSDLHVDPNFIGDLVKFMKASL